MKNRGQSISIFFCLPLIVALFIFSVLNCKKNEAKNPFTNILTLNCTNLILRNISLKDSTVEVTMQNTCENCQLLNVAYIPFIIIDRQTADTLNNPLCLCFNAPLNGTTQKYLIKTKLGHLPELSTLEFDFWNVCKDLAYLPN